MPELPEVQTMVNDLNKRVLNRTFLDVWTDTSNIIKKPKAFESFKKQIKGKTIKKIWRRAKNILIELSNEYVLLIHNKMTGHLLYGSWEKKNNQWYSKDAGPMQEKVNNYIHLVFLLDDKKMLALSDLRKFAKIELWEKRKLFSSKEFLKIGPEPLEKKFTFGKFTKALENKKGKIKQVLMKSEIIAGIGNIYSDEILWHSKVNPQKDVLKLSRKELKLIYKNIKKVLEKAVILKGESFSDFRDLQGEKGFFDTERKVYQREGEMCSRCGAIIKRIKMGGRSAHYCPHCQKI